MNIRFDYRLLFVVVALTAGLFFGVIDPAMAGPGGIIKAAASTFWGKVGMAALIVIFSPYLIWYYTKRHRHIKQVRRDLDLLAGQYPQYNWLDVRDRAGEVYQWVWSAWSQQKMSLASQFTTNWYWQNQQLVLDRWERDGLQNICHASKITAITPLYVEHVEANDGNGSRIVLEINAFVTDYVIEVATGKVVEGDKETGDLETIWTFKRVDGQWLLNQIEENTHEHVYLGMPSVIPATLRAEHKPAGEVAQ